MVASSQKQTHIISSLDVDNQPCSDPKLLESHIFSYFKSLMGSKASSKASLSPDVWSDQEKVYCLENDLLIAPFTINEIHTVIF
jgi:hypothetical protein